MQLKPPLDKSCIPQKLFEQIHKISEIACHAPKNKHKVLQHLINLHEAYNYVYYVYLVDKVLDKAKGRIVDWGGFCGQVTLLLKALGYKCQNYVLTYPSQKRLFDKLDIPYQVGDHPKKLPYKNNSCLALISSGVLEHVSATDTTDKESLEEIFRVLKPGGYFFCWNLPRKFAVVEFLSKYWHGTNCHPIKYTEKKFCRLLEETGFKVTYLDSHGGILTISFLRKILYTFNPWTTFIFDYYFSKLPFFNFFSHHITMVAQKRLHDEDSYQRTWTK